MSQMPVKLFCFCYGLPVSKSGFTARSSYDVIVLCVPQAFKITISPPLFYFNHTARLFNCLCSLPVSKTKPGVVIVRCDNVVPQNVHVTTSPQVFL